MSELDCGVRAVPKGTASASDGASSGAASSGAASASNTRAVPSAGAPDVGTTFAAFAATIARLRAPDGCPWDREQTHASIARNMAEEAYEAIDAIERNDMVDLREELGDVLLQVVLQSQIASEEGKFTLDDVVADVNEKMIRRHPHVFGDEAAFAAAHLTPQQVEQIQAAKTPGQVLDLWDQIKLIEKQQKAARKATTTQSPALEGLLDGVPLSLPALMQAQDISRKAVSVGFEWPDVASVWEQVASEIDEYRAERTGSARAAEEFGDVLFSLVNVARKEGIDAESALRSTCRKFRSRWAIMEQYAQWTGKHIFAYSTSELEWMWQVAKAAEAARAAEALESAEAAQTAEAAKGFVG